MAKRAKKTEDSELIKALKFAALAQDETGDPTAVHCRFINGYVVGFNGIIAAGALAPGVEANVCPHTMRLIDALERTKGEYSLTIVDPSKVSIKSDTFSAFVPCVGSDLVHWVLQEPNQYALTDQFREAATIALTFTKTGADLRVIETAAISQNGSLIGTNGRIFIEAAHGSAFPPGLVIPKEFFNVLAKIDKKIVGFGYADGAFGLTIWFDDQSWIRTQLYIGTVLPPFDKVFDWSLKSKPGPIAKGLFDGVRNVASFSQDGVIYINAENVRSHDDENTGATALVKNLEAVDDGINSAYLLGVETFLTTADFNAGIGGHMIAFFGERNGSAVRGLIGKIPRRGAKEVQPDPEPSHDPSANINF